MKFLHLILFLVLGFSILVVRPVMAQECHSTYGGEVCDRGDIEIDKEVWQEKDNQGREVKAWRERIDSNSDDGYTFKAGDEVKYRLIVRNDGDVRLKEVTVRDVMPQETTYLEWQWGGTWQDSTRTVEFKFNDFDPGQEKVFEMAFKFKGLDSVPNTTFCITNRGEAFVKDGDSDSDTADVCLREGGAKKVLGVTTLPSTGPLNLTILLIELGILAGLGSVLILNSVKAKNQNI